MQKLLCLFAIVAFISPFSFSIAADPSLRQAQPFPAPPQRGSARPQLQLTPDVLHQQLSALHQQIADLQSQVDALRAVIQITQNGTTIQAGNLTIKSTSGLTMTSGNNFHITSGADIAIQSQKDLSLKGGTTVSSEGAGQIRLKAPQIKLNNGSIPLALVGSTVSGGKIITGSSGIFVK